MSVTSKTKNASTVRNALLTTAMATGGALLLAGGAQAQGQSATPPTGFTPLSDISGVSRVEMGADGSMQLVMSDGRTVLIAANDVAVVDGIYFVSEAAIEANALLGVSTAAAAGGGGGAILGALGGLGLLGAAAGGGGGGGGSTPAPTPTPNTNPPVFSSATTASVDENTTGGVYTATATDADGNSISFSISGGADSGAFSINSSTGVLTFIANPDFEAPADADGDNVYEVTIRASDGTNTTDQTVTITVDDVDEAPAFTSAAAASVDENTAGIVYTAAATDPEGTAITYSLSGADAALFSIDAATGAVSFIAAPDYESPADADGDNVYEITVSASDGTNSTDQAVSITVAPVDEGPAAFSSGTTASFDENATGTIYTAVASDPDNSTITYSLGGAGDGALFAIDSATGALTFLAPPDFEAPADGDGDNVYEVTVRASDGTTVTRQVVEVTVNDVDEAPVVTSAATATTAENNAGVVYTATATDPEGAALTYSLTGADAALFTIDAATGEVSFLAAPDFETPLDADGDNVYEITVTASDGSNSDTQAVSITVTNLNEFAPVFTSATTDAVDEDSTGTFYTATATDADGDTLTYSIAAGGDGALFQIDSTTGELSFISSPDFENPADADTDNVYELTLQVSDGSTNVTQSLSVTVNNVNSAPVITSASSATYTENDTSTAYTIAATDGDGDAVVYSITGADSALFTVDAATGAVSFVASPDFESPADADSDNVYEINVRASDGVQTTTQSVSITVENENDVAPVITSGATGTIAENSAGIAYTATATDADSASLTYSLSGTDSALFQINSSTGAVSFITPADFETPGDAGGDNVYDITVTASDGDFSDSQAVAVTVTDVDETSGSTPVFTSGSSQTVSENQTSAYVARATDADGDTISYSISGADAALFTIDSASGEVRFLTTPNFESPSDSGGDNVYDIIVSASDGGTSADQAVAITVDNVTGESADIPEGDTTQIQMVSGGDFTGTLEVAGDRDWVAITLEAGQRYQFDAFGSGGAGVELDDTYIRLYDASGTLIAENDDITLGVNTDSRLGFTATTSGTYYVSVGAWEPDSGATLSGQYTLQVRHTDPLSAWNYQEIADYLDSNGFGGLQWDRAAGDSITVNITALTTAGQTLARAALQLWEDVTGISFTEVATGGEITFDDDEEGAFAGPDATSGGFITAASINVGTEWLDTYGTNIDGYSFQTYIHEIGHALGLGHGGPYDGSADYAVDAIYLNDSWQGSVMSYFSQNENTFINADFGYVIGPQVADIIAVLDMYGGSTSTRGGDTTYGYNSTAGNVIFDATAHSNAVSFTIFDTGGIDTMDYSGSAADQTLDLREQAYSSVLGRDGNVGIARGTVIENAIGGSGDDIFIGNDADNVLTGAGGADRFYASGGSDVFSGGGGSDTAVFSGASTDYTLSVNGSGNTVVTDNRAGAPDGVVELISVENIVYDGGTSNPEYFGDPDFAGREGLDPDDMPPVEFFDPDELGHGQGCPCAGCHAAHGDGDKEGNHDHVYPHLSDGDLALLLNLSDTIGDFRGEVGTNFWRNGEDAREDFRDAMLEWPVELEGALQTDKGHPVFESLTVPSAADTPVSQVAGAYGLEFFPASAFTDAIDARGAQMLTLSDDASDGWA